MTPPSPADLAWLHVPPLQMPTIVQHWDGLPAITLSKLSDGTARLMWVFDEDYPHQLGLFVHLTDKEAQTVFDTAPKVGLLERVRAHVADPDALLWHVDQRVMRAKLIEIPRTGDEDAFWAFVGSEVEAGYPFAVDMADDAAAPDEDFDRQDAARIALQVREQTLLAVVD